MFEAKNRGPPVMNCRRGWMAAIMRKSLRARRLAAAAAGRHPSPAKRSDSMKIARWFACNSERWEIYAAHYPLAATVMAGLIALEFPSTSCAHTFSTGSALRGVYRALGRGRRKNVQMSAVSCDMNENNLTQPVVVRRHTATRGRDILQAAAH